MEFSASFGAQLINPTPEREHELLRSILTQCVYAEEMGFDRVWTVEHHATTRYSHMSAPEVFLTAVAAKTSRIRIGHGVVCMAFNYNFPTRVCERAAMLDIISGGRLDLGAGRGGMPQELALCNVDGARTTDEVEESLRIIGQAWLKDEFEWHGKLLTIKAPEGSAPLNILPRPVQWPHPPLFMACTKPETVVRAGTYGVGAMVMGFDGPASIAAMRRDYDAASANRKPGDQVATITNHHFSVACPTVIADDRGSAGWRRASWAPAACGSSARASSTGARVRPSPTSTPSTRTTTPSWSGPSRTCSTATTVATCRPPSSTSVRCSPRPSTSTTPMATGATPSPTSKSWKRRAPWR
jgi:alkanesulfonate monooxygenase SsuD/methylene tetrahydromethanopterin reductase-like flavin-dependent oxidoreductase (luciferase family)